jgi:hypothetical protein
MEIIPPSSDDSDMVFLYQLVPGCASCSFASKIAELAGISTAIIARSDQVDLNDIQFIDWEYPTFLPFSRSCPYADLPIAL